MQLDNEKVYKEIFRLLPDLILITNRKGIIVYGNNQIVSWLGYDMPEIVGHSVLTLKFITTRSKLLMGKNFFRRISGQKIEPYIIDFRAKNGDMKSGLVRGTIIKDENGKTLLNVSLVTNVTKETNKKRSLESTETKYKYLFDNLVDGFTLNEIVYNEAGKPVDFKFLEINNSFEEVVGLESKKLVDKNMSDVVPDNKKDIFQHLDLFDDVVKNKKQISFEIYSDTLEKWLKITSHCPAPNQFVVFFQDISKQKEVVLKLKENKDELELKLKELEKINRLMVDRELEMVQLKAKLNE